MENIALQSFCKLCLYFFTLGKANDFAPNFGLIVVGLSARDTNVYKFSRLYFPYFTTFPNQTLQLD